MGTANCNISKADINDKMEIKPADNNRNKAFLGQEIIKIISPNVIFKEDNKGKTSLY